MGGPEVRRLVDEKLQTLRLLRALDRAGTDPEVDVALQVRLVKLAEADGMLDAMLDEVQGAGAQDPELRALIGKVPLAMEIVRGDVVDALPPALRERFRRASSEVAVSETEVWLEVEARRRGGGAVRATRRGSGPLSDEEAERLARQVWSAAGQQRVYRVDRRVRAHERKPLPSPNAPLRAWLDRLPRPWRETTARLHGVPLQGRGALALRLAERLLDPRATRRFLQEHLGRSERDLLARFLAAGLAVLDDDEDLAQALWVPWTLQAGPAPTVGGRLRTAGLVHVGTDGGRTLAMVPPPLQAMLASLLEEVDPEACAVPERALRQHAAEMLEDEPFDDAMLDHWKQLDRALSGRFQDWMLQSEDDFQEAFDAVFQGGPAEVRSDVESIALFEFALLDWKGAGGAPTLAERKIASTRFGSADEESLARATASAPAALYRVAGTHGQTGVTLVPLFPEGDPVFLTDRGLSLTAEPGWILGARIYPAGPYWFARVLGDPVLPESQRHLLRAAKRELRAHVRRGGAEDAAALLRDHPDTLIRLLRAYRG